MLNLVVQCAVCCDKCTMLCALCCVYILYVVYYAVYNVLCCVPYAAAKLSPNLFRFQNADKHTVHLQVGHVGTHLTLGHSGPKGPFKIACFEFDNTFDLL